MDRNLIPAHVKHGCRRLFLVAVPVGLLLGLIPYLHYPVEIYSNLNRPVTMSEVKIHPLPEPYRSNTNKTEFVDLLTMSHPKYLSNYQNPCWAEPLYATDGKFPGNFWWDERIKKHMAESIIKLPGLFAKRREEGKTWKIRCLPYFYVAGVTKCGTSDLFNKIILHPLITSQIKEIHWWNKARSMKREGGFVPISKYVDIMDMPAMEIENNTVSNDNGLEGFHPMILGEGSPSYFWLNAYHHILPGKIGPEDPRVQVARNILHVTPMAKIFIIFRNPINRAYSQYWYGSTKSYTEVDFHQRVIKNIKLMKDCMKRNKESWCVNVYKSRVNLGIGIYAVYLEKWLEIYPQKQLYTLRMEDYASNSTKILNDIFRFLGVGQLPAREVTSWQHLGIRNQHRPTPPMLEKTRQILADFYKPYNKRLSEMLEDKKYLWDS